MWGTPDTWSATLLWPCTICSTQQLFSAPCLREPAGPRSLVPVTADNGPSTLAQGLSVNPDLIHTPSIVWPLRAGEASIWNSALAEIKA